MKKIQFKSLSTRIWSMLVLMSVGIIIFISVIYSVVITQIERNYHEQVLRMAHELIVDDMAKYEEVDQNIDMRTLMRVNHILVKKDKYGQMTIKNLNNKLPIISGETLEIVNTFMKQLIEGEPKDELYIAKHSWPFGEGQNTTVYGLVEKIQPEEDIYLISSIGVQKKTIISGEIIGIGIALLISSFWIAKVIANSICKPLKKLEAHAFKIANKDWVEELEVKSEDEIGSLIHSINYMQARLQKKDDEQKKFLQSISHDLKTPIMVINCHAQAIIDEMYIDSVEHTAEIILNESKRLETKVGKMLYFNTLDYTLERSRQDSTIQFDQFIGKIIQKFQPLNQEMIWDTRLDPVCIQGNEEQLEIALENILDNQLRYAQTEIKIRLMQEHGRACLIIANDGEHIAADKIMHIFDYLYKDVQGKFGLGLAITQKIITFYGGSIEVSNEEEGVKFRIII